MEHELTCLIDKPTRTEKKGLIHTSTVIDVLLTNKPERFKCGGVYYPSLSDHALIYGIFKEKLQWHPNKVINLRSYKFDNLFQYAKSRHTYNTRYASNQNFCKPYIRTNTGKQMFSYKAIDLWHDIPSYLKDLSTFSFAKEVKQYLLFKQCS